MMEIKEKVDAITIEDGDEWYLRLTSETMRAELPQPYLWYKMTDQGWEPVNFYDEAFEVKLEKVYQAGTKEQMQ
jgi:hypothetical protein